MGKKDRRDWKSLQDSKPSMESMSSSEEQDSPQEDLIDFDGWWAGRMDKIPQQHKREIIKADFRGRGLTDMESMKTFDEALKLYGIKLS